MKRLFIIFLFIFGYQSHAQLKLEIDSIYVYDIIDTIPRLVEIDSDGNVFFEHISNEGKGPKIKLYCSFINNSPTEIVIYNLIYSASILFKYKNIDQNVYAFPTHLDGKRKSFVENENIKILPYSKFSFHLTSYIFLLEEEVKERVKESLYEFEGFSIDRHDYTIPLLEIIPTLRAKYKHQGIEVISDIVDMNHIMISINENK